MKLKYEFEMIDMEDEIIAVPVGKGADNLRGVLKLNKEGREILDLLGEDTTEEKIVDQLSCKYENNRNELCEYVKKTVEGLRKKGLLIE